MPRSPHRRTLQIAFGPRLFESRISNHTEGAYWQYRHGHTTHIPTGEEIHASWEISSRKDSEEDSYGENLFPFLGESHALWN